MIKVPSVTLVGTPGNKVDGVDGTVEFLFRDTQYRRRDLTS